MLKHYLQAVVCIAVVFSANLRPIVPYSAPASIRVLVDTTSRIHILVDATFPRVVRRRWVSFTITQPNDQ